MSFVNTIRPSISPRQATDDKRFPVALWHGATTVGGDVSGGKGTVSLQWPQLQGYTIACVDWVGADITGAAANVIVTVNINTNMVSTTGRLLVVPASFTALRDANSGTRGSIDLRYTPIFVSESDGQWSVDVETTNPGAGNNFIVTLGGFLWDRQSLNLAGGPVRPGIAY